MARPFQTDALNPSAIPSSSLGRLRPQSTSSRSFQPISDNPTPGAAYEVDLKKVHEEWNVRIDKEVKGIARGMKDLVDLADVRLSPSWLFVIRFAYHRRASLPPALLIGRSS